MVWLACLSVTLAAIAPFFSTLQAYFLGDDFGLVQLFSQKPPLHFLSLFTRPWTEEIYGVRPDELRPLIALSYQLDSLGGVVPARYHASNIAFHVLNSLLVFALARLIAGLTLPAAVFAAMLFAVLPVHAESVAWISGRADSVPTLFYVSSFLAYASWRRKGARWLYAASLALFLLALFSKQSAITMLATLLMYDLLVERLGLRHTLASTLTYVPFAAMTLSYLLLRYVLFGNAVREHQVSAEALGRFVSRQGAFLETLVFGHPSSGVQGMPPEQAWQAHAVLLLGITTVLMCISAELRSRVRRVAGSSGGAVLYFGPAWWLIGIAPLAVTYETPRHLYLVSVGMAIMLGVGFNTLWLARRGIWRFAPVLIGAALVAASTRRLAPSISEWNAAAATSERVSRDVQREADGLPDGSLLVIGAPSVGPSPRVRTWVWMWALPFALRPPFTQTDLTRRVAVVEPPDLYCCPRDQWFAKTRSAVLDWLARQDRTSALLLRWDSATGALTRHTELEKQSLRSQVLSLAYAVSPADMCRKLDSILEYLGDTCDQQ